MLDLRRPGRVVEMLVHDIKELAKRLREKNDCPYVNLVTNEKLLNSCNILARNGYRESLEQFKRENRAHPGFCFLIVRPAHRWMDISGEVQLLLKQYDSHATALQ